MDGEQDSYEPYVGSIRFYKHLILTILALLIIIPITICIVLYVRQSKFTAEYKKQSQLLIDQANELDKLRSGSNQAAGGNQAASGNQADRKENSTNGKKVSPDWKLIVVNQSISIPEDFTVDLADIGNGQFVDKRIEEPLNQMMEAAGKAGIHVSITSSYRSLEKQQGLFNDSVYQYLNDGYSYNQAFYKTKENIALPSESEHQTGLMVDIMGLGQKELNNSVDNLVEGNTPEMKWLKANCADYGFICRYPAGKSDITGINYEPYCFRYVGKEAAKVIMDSGITLEEYVKLNVSN